MSPLSRVAPIKPSEERTLSFGCLAFFLVFTAWYMIRPVREALGIARGAGDLPWLMIATVVATLFANPLFSKLTTRWPRHLFARRVYRFLALNLVGFHLVLVVLPNALGIDETARLWIGYGLFVWVSIFSLLIGSLLWSLSSEAFSPEAAGRLFGLLAAACSLGGLVGASITGLIAPRLDEPLHLLLPAALLLELAARTSQRIPARSPDASTEHPLTGSAFEGLALTLRSPYLLGISGYLLSYTIAGTLAYLIQGAVIDTLSFDLGGDIQRFAWLDQMTSAATLFVQLFCVRHMVRLAGVGLCLASLPLVFALGFGLLWAYPVYSVLAAFQVTRRVTNYGIAKPAREMLFTPLGQTEKLKAKNLIDLFVYRAGDTLGSLLHIALAALGLGLSGIAGVAVPVSLAWLAAAPRLGRAFKSKSSR